MLSTIVRNNTDLSTFVSDLGRGLSRPQKRHVLNVADALVTATGTKTLAHLNRQLVETSDVSNVADTFRIGPWTGDHILRPLRHRLIQQALGQLEQQPEADRYLLVNIDDSLLCKDPDTDHLEGVAWHYDHNANRRARKRMQNALSYILCNIVVGTHHFTIDIRPYLRESTVRRLNRQRAKEKRLSFVSKPELAKRILRDLRALLPVGVRVYVQCDAWFVSQKLLRYVARQGWQVIARIRSNRKLDRQTLSARFATLKHRRYQQVKVGAVDNEARTYLVRQAQGRLSGSPSPVHVWESKRHYRDHHPAYIICTDLTLSPQEGAQRYAKRWSCEVDNWYLKERLGLGDFRLQSYEAITKYIAVVQLAWAYLQWRATCLPGSRDVPAEVIRQHQQEHTRCWLRALCQDVLQTGNIELTMQRYLPAGAFC